MSDERKPVICPWCGKKMQAVERQDIFHGIHNFYECTNCESRTPIGYSIESAYIAATRTPPNPSLLLPELFELSDDDAAWVVAENGKIYAMGAECAQEWASEEHCLFFARKPTPEDIEAARVDGVANP